MCENQDEKKAKTKEEERGVKRSKDDWEEFAVKMKATAEKKAEESKNPGKGMDIDYLDVVRETRALLLGEPVVKFDEAAERVRGGVGLRRDLRGVDGRRFGRGGEEARNGDVQAAWGIRVGADPRALGERGAKSSRSQVGGREQGRQG